MLTYESGETLAHRLDPRSKMVFQVGFAVAAFARVDAAWLAALAGVASVVLVTARVSPVAVVRSYWFVFLILAGGPVLATVSVLPFRLTPEAAVGPAMQVARVALVFFVGAAYVQSTPVRETRAAIQRHVPGRTGQLLGVGVALTFRFVPVLRRDLVAVRDAMRARAGSNRSIVDRARRIGMLGLTRAFERADRLAIALQARCFAWNPTLPALAFGRADYPVLVAGLALAAAPLVKLFL
ncbi:energy-coupling factor transporter transmembrane protein EcfT [Halobacteria archaeon HArc-gm2]|nr:energy-coupling factor transporter transmembrane protein EcfT [Halobacteria archaeon HArc-gm2]